MGMLFDANRWGEDFGKVPVAMMFPVFIKISSSLCPAARLNLWRTITMVCRGIGSGTLSG